jgi:very-short-patch-repair endonuclease
MARAWWLLRGTLWAMARPRHNVALEGSREGVGDALHGNATPTHEPGLGTPEGRVVHVRTSPDRVIAEIAARQYGVVSRTQLVAAGIGAGAIHTRLAGHRLHRIHRGVYAVGHPALMPLAPEMAAVLACGEKAAISHRSAAVLWRLLRPTDEPIDVTLGTGSSRSRPRLRVHRSKRLASWELRHLEQLPVTAPARTLIDLADIASDRDLKRATDEALTRRLLNAGRLLGEMDRYRGRRGVGRLRALLERGDPPAITRSEAEERFLALVRAAGLPAPEVNVQIHGHEVDFLWRDEGLVVEVDGFQFHSTRAAFERDRQRDAELQSTGLRVLRVTWRQMSDAPYATLANLVRALSA